MRTIKFKARTLKGDIVYGCPIYNGRFIINGTSTEDFQFHAVDPNTIGQFTGAIVNGHEIYEGDTIKIMGLEYTVKYSEEYAAFYVQFPGSFLKVPLKEMLRTFKDNIKVDNGISSSDN